MPQTVFHAWRQLCEKPGQSKPPFERGGLKGIFQEALQLIERLRLIQTRWGNNNFRHGMGSPLSIARKDVNKCLKADERGHRPGSYGDCVLRDEGHNPTTEIYQILMFPATRANGYDGHGAQVFWPARAAACRAQKVSDPKHDKIHAGQPLGLRTVPPSSRPGSAMVRYQRKRFFTHLACLLFFPRGSKAHECEPGAD
jgi:hypothetical protein